MSNDKKTYEIAPNVGANHTVYPFLLQENGQTIAMLASRECAENCKRQMEQNGFIEGESLK